MKRCALIHRLPTTVRRTTGIALIAISLAISAGAQGGGFSTLTDGSTPLGIEGGAPAGSYALSGFDTVNLFNGNLNVALPLMQIGGRGGAQMTMTLPIETRWRLLHFVTFETPPSDLYFPLPGGGWGSDQMYGPGVLLGRNGIKNLFCGAGLGELPGVTLTRLTFIASDGTEYELRDVATEGKPIANPGAGCSGGLPPFNRGRVFVTSDGTSMTFVADEDSPIIDSTLPDLVHPSGYLLMRDGTCFRIDESLVTWIRDRNGNRLDFEYDEFGRVTQIKDSLNRVVTISHWDLTATPPVWFDQITFKGFGGAPRTIKVWYGNLSQSHDPAANGSNLFRTGAAQGSSGYSMMTMSDLFPLGGLGEPEANNDPWVRASVELPDGRRYKFFYNSYAELARVELPTGGAYEYDFQTDSGVVVSTIPSLPGIEIYRRIVERRTYPDGLTLEQRTTYDAPAGDPEYVQVNHLDQAGQALARERHYFHGSARDSLFQEAIAYPNYNDGKEYQTEMLESNNNVLRRVNNTFVNRDTVSWLGTVPEYVGGNPPVDPRLTETTTALTDVTPNLVAKQTYGYDEFNNRTDVREYDFGQGSPPSFPLRHTKTSYVVVNPVNNIDYTAIDIESPATQIHQKSLVKDQTVFKVNPSTGADIQPPAALTNYEYDRYDLSAGHAQLVNTPNICQHDTGFGTGWQPRGNVTSLSRWVNTTGTFLNSCSQFDIAGNIVKSVDPLGNPTIIDFSDRFGVPDHESQNNIQSPVELGLQSTYAFPTRVTNALLHTAYTQYDYYLGRPINGEDANNVVAKGRYDDPLDRPTQLVTAENLGSFRRRTLFTYNDPERMITIQNDQTVFQDGLLKTQVISDGLGRKLESREYESASAYITARQEFDALGRVKRSFNPFRTPSDETYGWTVTGYDPLGRITRVETFDQAGTSTGVITTIDQGNAITVVDQAGKSRRHLNDALGRLIRVDEPDAGGNLGSLSAPVQQTTYQYDVLDNRVKVSQGVQTRFYMHDSLNRLRRSRTPEEGVNSSLNLSDPVTGNTQWSCGYTYDENSNLMTRTDPRNITTEYSYDALDRVTSRTYLNDPENALPVFYKYDGQSLPAGAPVTFSRGFATGRLVAVLYGSATASAGAYQGYDQVGRVITSFQQTDGQNYGFTYGYNLAGIVTSEGYPSGRTISMTHDLAGRLASVSGQKTGEPNKTYVSSFSYAAPGALARMTLGNNLIEQTSFNSRLQPTSIQLGTTSNPSSVVQLGYTYGVLVGATLDNMKNNGNVESQTITIGVSAIKQSYIYDSLNRLQSAAEALNQTAKWTQSYAYDRYANRTSLSNSGVEGAFLPTTSTPSVNTTTNRISQSGFVYDAAGNLKQEPGKSYNYDAEGRLTSFNNGAATYTYDGDGRRVKKVVAGNPTTTTIFVYNAAGKLTAEYCNTGSSSSAGTSYLTTDHLGSTRVVTNGNGVAVSRRDYLPYGEEIPSQVGGRSGVGTYGVADGIRQNFTQKERDPESGLDYFLARYYSSSTGRFTSPDPKLNSGTPTQPQGLNRYSYVINNPLNHTDSDGLDWWYMEGQTMGPTWFNKDPGGKWKRWTGRFGLIYQITGGRYAGAWCALDPFNGRAYISADQAGAVAQFQVFARNPLGLISMTQADREFLAGFAEGVSPLGHVARWQSGKAGIDTDSRDYKGGWFIGGLVGAGIGITAEAIAAIRATGKMDPSKIRFSHDKVSAEFKDGRTLADLTEGLRNGTIKPTDVPPVRVVVRDGQLFTLDNRRLLAFQEAGVDIPVRMATRGEVAREAWKFTTKNGGTSVRVRGK